MVWKWKSGWYSKKTDVELISFPPQWRTAEPRGFHLSLRDSGGLRWGWGSVGNVGFLSKCMLASVVGIFLPKSVCTLCEPLAGKA